MNKKSRYFRPFLLLFATAVLASGCASDGVSEGETGEQNTVGIVDIEERLKSTGPSGLQAIGKWHLDDDLEAAIGGYDGSGKSGSPGTAATPVFTQIGVSGTPALDLSASRYVSLGDTASDSPFNMASTSKFSLSLWMDRGSSSAEKQVLLSKMLVNQTDDNGWALFLEKTGSSDHKLVFNFRAHSGGTANRMKVFTGAISSASGFQHVAVSYDGQATSNKVKIYVDGADLNTTVESDTLTGATINNAATNFGARDENESNDAFTGKLDEVRLFTGVLSANDVDCLYGNALDCPVGETLFWDHGNWDEMRWD